jgi:hypothetical protein
MLVFSPADCHTGQWSTRRIPRPRFERRPGTAIPGASQRSLFPGNPLTWWHNRRQGGSSLSLRRARTEE